MKNHFPVKIFPSDDLLVFYPAVLNPPEKVCKVTFGTMTIEAECRAHPKQQNILAISSKAAEKLMLTGTPPVSLHLFFHDDTLYIGPLLGIFTAGFTDSPVRPIGARTVFFSRLLSVKKTVGIHAFVFGEKHINWEKGTIAGLFCFDDYWKVMEVPFPNVIYDRLPNRHYEKKDTYIDVKNRLQKEYLIPWYNPGFFNKLDVFERLAKHPEAKEFLPDTRPADSVHLIDRMLSEYGHVYLKPVNGSGGEGIHQFIYDRSENMYYCRYQDRGENRLIRSASLEGLYSHIFERRRPGKMLVQQGINLLRIGQRPVDFRIHTNKDHTGKWQVSAMAVKIARRGSATTHIRHGGSIKTIKEIFQSNQEQEKIAAKLAEACLTLSKALEEVMDGIIAEIGFDIGMDRDGNVWLFEANSKPGRAIFKHPGLRKFDILTRKLSLAYSIYLTEQSIARPEEIYS